ncbi:hypothetical protein R1sor_019781 [Riccia sorocarpa]|uniref:Glutamine amidotransferase domain-containing protein n=1 Tax=Riccia sorocarpa TaxID=122646 RepID=A0ABD3IGS8_9MARC
MYLFSSSGKYVSVYASAYSVRPLAGRLRVALFQCERLEDHLAPSVFLRTGGYCHLLQRAFDHFSRTSTDNSSLPSIELTKFDVKLEEYPADLQKFAGVLISGSLSGVYDNEPWISRLLQEIQVLDRMKFKTCGISFGHQAIAQALGGKVGRNPKGSEVSVRRAKLTEAAQKLFGTERQEFRLHYHHNDAILELPEDFSVLASNNVTQYQSIYKLSHFLTFCGHPDYSHNVEVLEKLLEYDREKLWVHEQLVEYGLETLHQPTDYMWVLKQIVRFYSGALDRQN